MMDNPNAYRRILLERAFPDERNLLMRKKMHDLYSDPPIDMPDWALNRFNWHGDERVLDIGSGPGTYLKALLTRIPLENYVAGDLSRGMLRALRRDYPEAHSAVMDAEEIPFKANTFDVVLANHMLYHVPDIDRALDEIQRVLHSPGGVLIAAASSEYTMPEFTTLIQRAVRLLRKVPGEEMNRLTYGHRFSLETGPTILARHFQAVARFDIPSVLSFTDAKPVMDYIESNRTFYEERLPQDVAWDDFMEIMTDQVRRLVEHFGELVVNKLVGVMVATNEGGFAEEYRRIQSDANQA